MKALITGGTGFVGRYLVRELSERGFTCRLLVRQKSQTDWLNDIDNIELWQGDVADPPTLVDIGKDVDIVFHLAALLGDWPIAPEEIMRINKEGTRNILAALTSVEQFIFCSTPGVQGFGYKRAKECLPYHPRGIYERSKVAAEKIVMRMCVEKKINWTILRPDFVYGPDDLRRIPLYKKIAQRKMYILGSGKACLTPTYIEDVIQGFINCIDNENAANNIFNISGETLTVEKYLGTIAKISGSTLPRIRIPLVVCYSAAFLCELLYKSLLKKEPPITTNRVAFLTQHHGTDNQKAHNLLNFKPAFSFREGIEKTIAWCKSEGHL